MFLCNIHQDTFDNGSNPDKNQIGTEWLPINDLLQHKLFPQALRTHLIDYFIVGKPPLMWVILINSNPLTSMSNSTE